MVRLSLGADLGAGWYIRSSGPTNQPPTYYNYDPVYALLRLDRPSPPPLPLFISAAPSSVVGPRARNQCLLRGDSVTDVKRGDGWRVVPFASSSILFEICLISVGGGGRRGKEKGESGSFLRRSLDQVVGWISVWVIIYSCVRIGFGIQGSWLMIKGTEWRGGYLLLIAWNYFEINVLIFWINKVLILTLFLVEIIYG